MRKIISVLLMVVLALSLVGCSSQKVETSEQTKEEVVYVEMSGIVENMVFTNNYVNLIVNIDGKSQSFILSNSKYIFDESHSPKAEPYIEKGVYVKIRCSEEELTKNTPKIDKITVTSYDGVFVL